MKHSEPIGTMNQALTNVSSAALAPALFRVGVSISNSNVSHVGALTSATTQTERSRSNRRVLEQPEN